MPAPKYSDERRPPEFVRSKRVTVKMTPGEYHDLLVIADSWGVGSATAAYAMVSTFLSGCREMPLHLAAMNRVDRLAILASSKVMDAYTERKAPVIYERDPNGTARRPVLPSDRARNTLIDRRAPKNPEPEPETMAELGASVFGNWESADSEG